MLIKIQSGSITKIPADALIVNLFKGVKTPGGATGAADKVLGGKISELIKQKELTGKLGEAVLIHDCGNLPAKRVIVVGLGEQKKFDLNAIRTASAAAIRLAKKSKVKKIISIIHGAGIGGFDAQDSAQATVEGTILGAYKFPGYFSKKDEEETDITSFIIVEQDQGKIKSFKAGVEVGEILANCQNEARDLVSTPANKMTPTIFASHAKKIAKENGLVCSVLDPIKEKWYSLMAIAQGSVEPAKVVVLNYHPAYAKASAGKGGGQGETTALIGKGITFDSGGISIKPSSKMWEMKTDMAGAAATLMAMAAISQLKLKKNVLAVIPLTENMPCGGALKPGDVISSLAGITTEVISTDAEGRMILADAITYAKKKGAKKIIDCATLTGGCIVALGDVASGLLGNDDKLIKEVEAAAENTGERVWNLPIYEEYEEYLKSSIADHMNCTEGGRGASASTGAIYLKKYVGETPWVHLDIAGTAYLSKGRGCYGKGATGWPMRTMVEYFRK